MNYEKFLIKDFKHWAVYLHLNQYYLGRVYIWAKRADSLDLFEISSEEKEELFIIGIKLKEALGKLFSPDIYNYVVQANVTPHLHMHFIPRYKSSRIFEGIEFKDERWGKNYAPYDYDFKVSEDILTKIRDAIKDAL